MSWQAEIRTIRGQNPAQINSAFPFSVAFQRGVPVLRLVSRHVSRTLLQFNVKSKASFTPSLHDASSSLAISFLDGGAFLRPVSGLDLPLPSVSSPSPIQSSLARSCCLIAIRIVRATSGLDDRDSLAASASEPISTRTFPVISAQMHFVTSCRSRLDNRAPRLGPANQKVQ